MKASSYGHSARSLCLLWEPSSSFPLRQLSPVALSPAARRCAVCGPRTPFPRAARRAAHHSRAPLPAPAAPAAGRAARPGTPCLRAPCPCEFTTCTFNPPLVPSALFVQLPRGFAPGGAPFGRTGAPLPRPIKGQRAGSGGPSGPAGRPCCLQYGKLFARYNPWLSGSTLSCSAGVVGTKQRPHRNAGVLHTAACSTWSGSLLAAAACVLRRWVSGTTTCKCV